MRSGSLFSPSSWRKRNHKVSSSSQEQISVSSDAGRTEKPLPDCPYNNSELSVLAGNQVVADRRPGVNLLPNASHPSHIHTSIGSSSSSATLRSLIETSDISIASSGSAFTPPRPPRPPSLNLASPPLSPSRSCPGTPAPLASLHRPKHQHVRTITFAHPDNRMLHAKRSMPELDGVWKGFLEDVDESVHSLSFKHSVQNHSDGNVSRYHHRSASRHHVHGESNAGPPFVDRNSPLAAIGYKQTTPQKPRLPEQHHGSESSPYLPYLEYAERNSPAPSLIPVSADCGPESEFSLSLFPAPPPLIIRKKVPKPLVLKPTPAIAPPLASPNAGSTDSTPVATPTTPTQPVRKPTSPVSILKKSSPSSCVSSPTSATFPSSPLSLSHDKSPSSPYFRPARLVQSVSHPPSTFTRLAVAHRTTSSDSLSDCSSSSSHRSRLHPSHSSMSVPQSYLQASGRRPKPRTRSPPQVEWGIAV